MWSPKTPTETIHKIRNRPLTASFSTAFLGSSPNTMHFHFPPKPAGIPNIPAWEYNQ
jgi:hypothetical protein